MATVAEPACDLRIGQVGVATLKLRRLDLADIREEMSAKVRAAPQMLARAPVIVDLNVFSDLPDAVALEALLATLRQAGVLPVGLTYGSTAIEALSREAGLPLFSRFRENYESAGSGASAPAPAAQAAAQPVEAAPAARAAAAEPAPATGAATAPMRVHEGHVRSGQQVYARGQDLTIVGTVGAGAEVIADGNVHIYGALRGRALAGAAGDERTRVFCREFQAELVAVAGHYRVLEDAPTNLHGRAVQIRLDGERLVFEPL